MNKKVHSVRHEGDRRVRRTQQALIQALVQLVLEKRYHAITIQELLDRADIGRSTFYTHYRGKDDLLLRSFEGLLEALDREMEQEVERGRRVAPVCELFRHVGELRSFHQALVRAGMVDRLYQVGTNQLSRTIARRLAALPPGRGGVTVPLPVVAQACAGALFALLRWWVDNGAPHSPERMDEMYHTIWLRPA